MIDNTSARELEQLKKSIESRMQKESVVEIRKKNDEGNDILLDGIRDLLRKGDVVQVSIKNGKYIMKTVSMFDTKLLILIMVNVLMVALLLTKLAGLW